MACKPDLSGLGTLVEANQVRRAVPKGAEPSRLQMKEAKRVDESAEERRWKKEIWKRDKGCCRWCKRKVRKCLDLVPDRGECHHAVPRENKITRWDARAALLLCKADHERLTGKVAEKFVLVASKTFTVEGVAYPDMRKPVTFKRIV